jgi:hypothetical protein
MTRTPRTTFSGIALQTTVAALALASAAGTAAAHGGAGGAGSTGGGHVGGGWGMGGGALAALRRRYARGELDDEAYESRRRRLVDDGR